MKITAKFNRATLLWALLFIGGCGNPWFSGDEAINHYVSALSMNAAAQHDDAIAELEAAVKIDQEFSLAYSMLGDLYRQRGNYQQSAHAYEQACELDPWAFEDHLYLGEVYKILKRFVRAIEVLKRACQLKPDSPQANYTLGVCYYETGKYEQAVNFCGKAAELDPDNERILASLGDIYSKKGDHQKAVNAYKQALETGQGDQLEIMIKLGATYIQMKRYGPAELILAKAIEVAPDKAEPYIALGYCLLSQRKMDNAVQSYQKAIDLDQYNVKAHNGVGVAYMMMFLNAKQDKKLSNPTLGEQYKELAQKALESWHHSLELDPDQPKIEKLVDRYAKEVQSPGS